MAKYDEITKKVNDVESNIESKIEEAKDFNLLKHTSETRSKIANTFVKRFFWIILWWTVAILLHNLIVYLTWKFLNPWENTDIKDILINVSSALPILISAVSWPLGFVVGYYFKTESSKQGIC